MEEEEVGERALPFSDCYILTQCRARFSTLELLPEAATGVHSSFADRYCRVSKYQCTVLDSIPPTL